MATKVKEILSKHVVTVPKDATLQQVAKILGDHKISGAPVVDHEGRLVGVISEKDLFRALYPGHAEFYDSPGVWVDLDQLEERTVHAADKLVADLMTRDVVTVNPEATLMQVGSIMLVRGIHRVVVMDQHNRIAGVVTRSDIYRTILKTRLSL